MSKFKQEWLIETFEVPPLMVNSYILADKQSREAFIIDPGEDVSGIMNRVRDLNLIVMGIINTHGHWDHIGGNQKVKEITNAPLMIGAKDSPMLTDATKNLSSMLGLFLTSPSADRELIEGDILTLGEGRLRVMETPGHSPGSVSLEGDGFVFVGDLVFAGSIGRTDFKNGDLKTLLNMVHSKILPLGDETIIYPGHGEKTTVGEERQTNPFLQPGFDGNKFF